MRVFYTKIFERARGKSYSKPQMNANGRRFRRSAPILCATASR